jgi:UPF0716 protein FxsA
VAGNIGVLNTIAVLILISVVGAWLVKREGIGVVRRLQAQLDRGRVPGRELTDAFLIMLAGVLMLTPGFLTDILGLALLFPPTRMLIRDRLHHRFAGRVTTRVVGDSRVYEARSAEIDRP